MLVGEIRCRGIRVVLAVHRRPVLHHRLSNGSTMLPSAVSYEPSLGPTVARFDDQASMVIAPRLVVWVVANRRCRLTPYMS